jgi:hypothetical protein
VSGSDLAAEFHAVLRIFREVAGFAAGTQSAPQTPMDGLCAQQLSVR